MAGPSSLEGKKGGYERRGEKLRRSKTSLLPKKEDYSTLERVARVVFA